MRVLVKKMSAFGILKAQMVFGAIVMLVAMIALPVSVASGDASCWWVCLCSELSRISSLFAPILFIASPLRYWQRPTAHISLYLRQETGQDTAVCLCGRCGDLSPALHLFQRACSNVVDLSILGKLRRFEPGYPRIWQLSLVLCLRRGEKRSRADRLSQCGTTNSGIKFSNNHQRR